MIKPFPVRPAPADRLLAPALLALLIASVGGCARTPRPAAAAAASARPVTDVDPALAEPSYWLAQPPVAAARSNDIDALWQSVEQTARDFHFTIDRRDYRAGLLTTHPTLSKQFFELWRNDAAAAHDVFENSLGTIRRTIRFQFEPQPDSGAYVVSPKVLVERYSVVDPKYRQDEVEQPTSYWYALGRDHALERKIARWIERRLPRAARS